jgi:hypothetical protein
MFVSSVKIAEQLIKLLANMNISATQWKFSIPDRLTEEHMGVLANAKNLADGINYSLDRKGIDIDPELMVSSSDYVQYTTREGKVAR